MTEDEAFEWYQLRHLQPEDKAKDDEAWKVLTLALRELQVFRAAHYSPHANCTGTFKRDPMAPFWQCEECGVRMHEGAFAQVALEIARGSEQTPSS